MRFITASIIASIVPTVIRPFIAITIGKERRPYKLMHVNIFKLNDLDHI